MRNWLTFDGVSTKDFGVYINGAQTYNAPARSREIISVPGRNGDLIIDNGRYENTDVVYHAFIYRDFGVNVEGFRNLLLSRKGYVRIEDTYHPDEFRFGIYNGNFSADVVEWLEAGEFDLTFNCKPQRFLKDGYDRAFGADAYSFTSDGSLLNDTAQTAKPLLRVYGTGTFTVGSGTMTISSASTYTDIDCDLMDAYKGSTNCNGNISGTFPTLEPGSNAVDLPGSGISKIEIIPRWWKL